MFEITKDQMDNIKLARDFIKIASRNHYYKDKALNIWDYYGIFPANALPHKIGTISVSADDFLLKFFGVKIYEELSPYGDEYTFLFNFLFSGYNRKTHEEDYAKFTAFIESPETFGVKVVDKVEATVLEAMK